MILSILARRALPALAAISLAAGAAHAQKPSGRELPWAALLDSAALVRAVAELPAATLPRDVPPIFVVTFDTTGAVWAVRPLSPRVPADYADPVMAALRASARPPAPLARSQSVYLRVTTGPNASVVSPVLVEEQPALANRAEIQQALRQAAARHALRLAADARDRFVVDMKFRVMADGIPDEGTAQVLHTSTDPALDDEALAVVRRMRFRPATVAGVPVAVWVTLPINFFIPRERPRSTRP